MTMLGIRLMRTAGLVILATSVLIAQTTFSRDRADRPRLIVLTDIGGDPDDQQSMIRLMTYANEFDIEGLIASASGTPGELKNQAVVRPDLIREIVTAYGEVRTNLERHAAGYPSAEQLLRATKAGNPQRGVSSIGDGKDTEGSNWIIAAADRSDPRPLCIPIWGGSTDLAQALWRVRKDRGEPGVAAFVSKLRVHAIGHQDDTGPWILENFPDLFYILSAFDQKDVLGRPPSGSDRRQSVYRGMYLGGDESLTSREWIDTHVRTGHGPLGALYPIKTWTAPNPHGVLKEGDTPSWFYFLRTGMNDPQKPGWGSWGGRFRKVRGNFYNDAPDTVEGVSGGRVSVWRWRPAFQNDFAARMDWCVDPDRKSANHAPVAILNGSRSRDIVQLSARPGQRVRLDARGSSDPDGNALRYRWFVYKEAGAYQGALQLIGDSNEQVEFVAPEVQEPSTIHIILELTDGGSPTLTAYRRTVITVHPAQKGKQ